MVREEKILLEQSWVDESTRRKAIQAAGLELQATIQELKDKLAEYEKEKFLK